MRLPLRKRFQEYCCTPIRDDHLLEAEMLLLAFATGMADASTYAEYRVFTANQTGNTLLVAICTADIATAPIVLRYVATSLTMFLLGSWITGQLGHFFGCRARWWLILSNFTQTILVFGASAIQFSTKQVSYFFQPYGLAAIALLAFSYGAQVAVARSLHMTQITTANATSAYVDLLIDIDLFNWHNLRRNRRIVFLITLISGSFVGAYTFRNTRPDTPGITPAISACFKALTTILFFFNKGMEVQDERSKSFLGSHLPREKEEQGYSLKSSGLGTGSPTNSITVTEVDEEREFQKFQSQLSALGINVFLL